ncbi:membrane bound O-acyl transferase [Rhizoclosmatium globosum]|uniref:Membrane bound O-acyl transferase n=1 Tax=Rhizoclosmatium globosum TaxID=329046 RepID=A0A1Y2CTV2_9FUNG|nr:membrane bound O-acyl transferase [Rhizoclosmatium globosum]|eukprot:ORY50451.1 membrane bound O-acyl transferase [Rhizoclosmatium globosum]
MVVVIKWASFSWSLHDIHLAEKGVKTRRQSDTTAQALNPPLLEFFGYIFFTPSFFVGPALEFPQYQNWKHRRNQYETNPYAIIPLLKTLLLGALCSAVYVRFDDAWAHKRLLDPVFVASTGFWFRLLFLQIAGVVTRCKYYGVWKVGEVSCILSGISLSPNGVDWREAENVDPWGLETAQNPQAFIGHWNMFTNRFLHRNVYMRLVENGGVNKGIAQVITKVTSAFWHGWYPGYYLTFVGAAGVTWCAGVLRKELRGLFVDSKDGQRAVWKKRKVVYDIAGWVATHSIINYVCAPFPLEWIREGLAAWASVGFAGHWLMAGVFVFKLVGGFTWISNFAGSHSKSRKLKTQ